MAIRFSEEGCRIVLHGTSAKGAEETANLCIGETEIVLGDIRDPETSSQLVEAALGRFGRIDILVNNAAINTYRGPCLDFGETEFDRIVDVNVKSVYRLTRLVAPGMVDRGSGSIINIAALAGIRPEPDNLLYNMTKAAVISMTKSYALELSPKGVRVNAIAPGVVDTEMTAHIWQDEERLRAHLARQPVPHLGQPEEIAEVALTLASERSSLVTGQVFVVDGGLLLT